jgi:two-component system, NarL family, sensor kinase
VVEDDGHGFDPGRRPGGARFGLRGLASLIAEAGGHLDVRSAPGEGTTIRLEVTGSST